MMKIAAMAAVCVALSAPAGTPAEAAREPCEATVTERLNRLNVDRSDIRNIHYVAIRRGGRDGGRLAGFEAWVGLRSCKGNLVIEMSRHCRVRQVYGRGACDLGGAIDAWQ